VSGRRWRTWWSGVTGQPALERDEVDAGEEGERRGVGGSSSQGLLDGPVRGLRGARLLNGVAVCSSVRTGGRGKREGERRGDGAGEGTGRAAGRCCDVDFLSLRMKLLTRRGEADGGGER
jgi:hypothetical protein